MLPNALRRLFATCEPEKWGIGHEENCARHRDICCAGRLGHRRRQITLRRASLKSRKALCPSAKTLFRVTLVRDDLRQAPAQAGPLGGEDFEWGFHKHVPIRLSNPDAMPMGATFICRSQRLATGRGFFVKD